jgi:hypothetical protein
MTQRLEELSSPKDERKIRLILAMVSLKFDEEYADLNEYLKKFRPNKMAGFDFDLILNGEQIALVSKDQQSKEFREYYGIGNATLVNNQGKHYSNKPPQGKDALYGDDKGVLTRALSSSPAPGERTLNSAVKEIRSIYAADLYNWDLGQIRLRRTFILDQFISVIPGCLIL